MICSAGYSAASVSASKRPLWGRAVPLPAAERQTLAELLGPLVDEVRVIEYSWFARLHGRVIATTRQRCIYLSGSASEFFDDPNAVLHEYCHVLQQWETRRLSVWKYLLEWFRVGYWDNRFEIEAREFATDHLHRYCALLARHRAQFGGGSASGSLLALRAPKK
jgi:hypothetical protein